jgi:hypothetical protein
MVVAQVDSPVVPELESGILLTPIYTAAGPISGAAGAALGQFPLFSFTSVASDTTSYPALIDWGDGHGSFGTIEATPQGTFDVYGDHTYAQSGTFAITVIVTDDQGARFVGGRQANITLDTDADNFGGYANVDTGNIVLTTIADPEGDDAAQPTALVSWGDGSISAATVRFSTSY